MIEPISTPIEIRLDRIVPNPGPGVLNGDRAKIIKFAALLTAGVVLPPIEIFLIDGGLWGVNDGRHRVAGARLAGRTTIMATIAPHSTAA